MYLDMHRDQGSWGYVIDETYKAVFGWGKVISSGIIGPGSQRLSFFLVSSWCLGAVKNVKDSFIEEEGGGVVLAKRGWRVEAVGM